MSEPQSGFRRLKERKLVQWAAAYVAGAWLVLEVLDVLIERFGWSERIFQGATLVLAVGLLGALILAWYHGEKRQQKVSGPEL